MGRLSWDGMGMGMDVGADMGCMYCMHDLLVTCKIRE